MSGEDKIKKKMGRPVKLTEAKAKKMCELAAEGKTDVQVAEILNVSEPTIYNWQRKNEDLLLSYRAAKHKANEMVEASLFQRAMGYQHEAEKIFFDSKSLSTIREKYTEHYPPDTAAMQFWLKNRDPDRWKDKTEVKTEGEIKTITETPAEQLQRIKEMLKDDTK